MIDSYKIKEGLKVLKREVDGKNITELYVNDIIQLSIDEKGIITTPNVFKTDLVDNKNLATVEYLKDYVDNKSYVHNITYAEALDLQSNDNLQIGELYLLSDFKTIYRQAYTNIINNSAQGITDGLDTEIEPLLLTANGVSDFNIEATSILFPRDIIYYNIISTLDAPNNKGMITYREDTINNVSTHYDWRNIKFRRYFLDFTSNIAPFQRDNITQYNNELWISLSNSNSNPIVEGDDWTKLVDYNNNSTSPKDYLTSGFTSLNIYPKSDKYINLYTFTDENNINVVHTDIKNIKISKGNTKMGNNVFMSDNRLHNINIRTSRFENNSFYNHTSDEILDILNGAACRENIIVSNINGHIEDIVSVLSFGYISDVKSLIKVSTGKFSSIVNIGTIFNGIINKPVFSTSDLFSLYNVKGYLEYTTIIGVMKDINMNNKVSNLYLPQNKTMTNIITKTDIDFDNKSLLIDDISNGDIIKTGDTIRFKKYKDNGILESIEYSK